MQPNIDFREVLGPYFLRKRSSTSFVTCDVVGVHIHPLMEGYACALIEPEPSNPIVLRSNDELRSIPFLHYRARDF